MSANAAIFNPTESTSAATGDGFSVPRLTTTGRLAITFGTGDKGMMVYDTTLNNLFIWNGSAWESVPASGDAGANGSVQYNDNGVVSGAPNFTYDKATSAVAITGDLTVDTNTLKVDSANNFVGVGTTTGVNLAAGRGNLTIGGSSSAILNLSIGATDTGYVIHDGTSIYLVNRIAAGSLIFSTNSTERFRIDSSGNVGIGVTPSAWGSAYKALQMQSLAFTSDANSFYQANNAFINSTPAWTYIASNYAVRYDQDVSGGNHKWYNAPSGTAGNAITWTQAMTLDASGNLLVGVTSANASGGVLQLKSGITFPATQVASSDANTLDDYEEGTFTPSITFGGASVGMTGTFAGRYTKVGRAVTINGIIALTAKGSSTGIAKIAGLPFTSANALGEYTAISIRLDRVSFADYPCGYVGPNSSVVELENTTNAGTVSSMTDSNFINTSVVIVNFTYTV